MMTIGGTDRAPEVQKAHPLWDVARYFLRLGCTAFGGPAAHIALMEYETVQRRRWLSRDAFMDLLGATNLIPGPSSTQMAMNLGYSRAGGWGLVVGGLCFILPASLITLGLAWGYARFGRWPQVQGMLYGLKPVVLAVVAQAIWGLGRAALKRAGLVVMAIFALTASLLGVHPLMILLGAGAGSLALHWSQARSGYVASIFGWCGLPALVSGSFGMMGLFIFFLKMGSVAFGSGYVLLAFLKADLVDRWHWLTQAQLLDAVAVGQITPGPVFTTATFIGYLLGGLKGAALATVGIFLPSFFFMAVLTRLLPRLRKSPSAGVFLDGVNAGAIALLASVGWQLGRSALVDGGTIGLGILSFVLLLRYRTNPTWWLLGGAAVGLLITWIHA